MASKLWEAFEALVNDLIEHQDECGLYVGDLVCSCGLSDACDALRTAIDEAEREAEALRADKARLDWLEAQCRRNLYYSAMDGQGWWSIGWNDWSPTLRQAIDLARASEASGKEPGGEEARHRALALNLAAMRERIKQAFRDAANSAPTSEDRRAWMALLAEIEALERAAQPGQGEGER